MYIYVVLLVRAEKDMLRKYFVSKSLPVSELKD